MPKPSDLDEQLAEAFAALKDTPPAKKCHMGWLLQQMSPTLRVAVQEAFRRPGVEIATIHNLLERGGYELSYSSVSHHARRMRGSGRGCKCPVEEVGA